MTLAESNQAHADAIATAVHTLNIAMRNAREAAITVKVRTQVISPATNAANQAFGAQIDVDLLVPLSGKVSP